MASLETAGPETLCGLGPLACAPVGLTYGFVPSLIGTGKQLPAKMKGTMSHKLSSHNVCRVDPKRAEKLWPDDYLPKPLCAIGNPENAQALLGTACSAQAMNATAFRHAKGEPFFCRR